MPANESTRCTVCGAPGQNLGGGFWIKLRPKHHAEESAKSNPPRDDAEEHRDYDFPCGY